MFSPEPAFSRLSNGDSSEALALPLPLIDLAQTESKDLIVKACEEFGFFKVVNHGVPLEFISALESEAIKFFSLPLSEKERAGPQPPSPFGYGNKNIGLNGDVGWLEYLLLTTNPEFDSSKLPLVFRENPEVFRGALNDYITAIRNMGCEILELMADGLKIQQRNVFSKLLKDERSDSVFRINHYPPRTELDRALNGRDVIGFGEHTDPQIISILRSNGVSGLEIQKRGGSWICVPPDERSFFVNVGDSLQVMTNGRFRSVKHRVKTNGEKSRISMVYFGGPPLSERIGPLPSLVRGNESLLYREFTWFDYKKSAYATRLSDNRLQHFERIAAS